jgi:flavin-dependent dehydrogenase
MCHLQTLLPQARTLAVPEAGDIHDVLVIGAGPAGACGATLLAQRKRRVALIDRAAFPSRNTLAGWLNVRAAPLLGQLGVTTGTLLSEAFRDVTFFNADFSKRAKPNFKDAPAYLIDRAKFGDALVDTARRQGVALFHGCGVRRIHALEREVVAELDDDRRIRGRLLLLASGRGSALLDQLGFTHPDRHGVVWTAQVDRALRGGGAQEGVPRVGVALGLDRKGSFGMCSVSRHRLCVAVNWYGDQEQTTPCLVRLCRAFHQQQISPVDLSGEAAASPVLASPASAALDMDTHVRKHSLLVGDAGGFVSAASNEGIYPAMWSAQIAAEVLDAALNSPQSQDELMSFEQKWRTTMADYLRSPNTDIQFLLPLIFSNQPMADRMGAAFFSGENI